MTAPASAVTASAAFSDRIRAWELHTYGARRHVAQLRNVTIIHTAPATKKVPA